MPQYRLACPHCSHTFALENPPAERQVSCPACGQALALPEHLPAASQPPGPTSSFEGAADLAPTVTSPADVAAPPSIVDQGPAAPAVGPVRHLSREEKVQRRQTRSLVLMIVGVVLLAVAAVVLSRL